MKKTKKLIALLLCAVMMVASADYYVLAASAPYSGIVCKYSKTVSRGSIRYISQCSSSSNYHSEYWGKYSALHECGTSSMSMALSFIGVNVTPGEILEKYNGSTVFASNWGGINASKDYTRSLAVDAFETAWNKYVSGEGQYSPPIIHINGTSSNVYYKNGHFMLVIGKNSDGTYKILDPYDEQYGTTWNAKISGGKITIKLGSKASETRALADVRQYHRAFTSEEIAANTDTTTLPTISGAVYPEKIVVGKAFSIKGDISSKSALTSVEVYVQDYYGKNIYVNKSTPNTKTFSIATNVDKYIKFGTLSVGHYKYIVKATNAAGTKTLLSKTFVVTSTSGEIPPLPVIETPETPETPESPESTQAPETPESSQTPETPESSQTPETPESSQTPESPETQEPSQTPEVAPATYATISGSTYPTSLLAGKSFTIKGVISSESNITKVTVSILNSAGKTVFIRSATPDAKSYDLSTGMDPYVKFSSLAAGNYKYNVTATNEAGTKTLLSKDFKVISSSLTTPVISSVSNASTGMKIAWEKVANASGYYVYRKNSDGSYSKVGTVTSGSTVTYNDKTANTSGTSYTYKVYAYITAGGSTVKSSASAVKTYVRVGTVGGLTLTTPSTRTIKVTYNSVSKASGYIIQYSRYSDYSNSLKVTTTASTKSVTTSRSKALYYVRVRAKIVKGSTTYYGAWTKKTITVK